MAGHSTNLHLGTVCSRSLRCVVRRLLRGVPPYPPVGVRSSAVAALLHPPPPGAATAAAAAPATAGSAAAATAPAFQQTTTMARAAWGAAAACDCGGSGVGLGAGGGGSGHLHHHHHANNSSSRSGPYAPLLAAALCVSAEHQSSHPLAHSSGCGCGGAAGGVLLHAMPAEATAVAPPQLLPYAHQPQNAPPPSQPPFQPPPPPPFRPPPPSPLRQLLAAQLADLCRCTQELEARGRQ